MDLAILIWSGIGCVFSALLAFAGWKRSQLPHDLLRQITGVETRCKAIESEWAAVFLRWKALEGRRYREQQPENNRSPKNGVEIDDAPVEQLEALYTQSKRSQGRI